MAANSQARHCGDARDRVKKQQRACFDANSLSDSEDGR
jgi:hypothetical protein